MDGKVWCPTHKTSEDVEFFTVSAMSMMLYTKTCIIGGDFKSPLSWKTRE